MATTAKRLKKIVREQEFTSYRQLVRYVEAHCGETLRKAVLTEEADLTRYIDARFVARQRPYIYRKPNDHPKPRLKYR